MVFVHAFESESEVLFADTKDLLEQAYRIRYRVYCEEFGFEQEAEQSPGLEIDQFDSFSHHYLIRCKATEQFVGTIRMVLPRSGSDGRLPIEEKFGGMISQGDWHPSNCCKSEQAEIGRLAVLKEYRNLTLQNPELPRSLRLTPIVVIALYLAVAAECRLNQRLQRAYLIVEPRLARHLKTLGVCFEQIGPGVNFRGKRAPFVMLRENWNESFKGHIFELYRKILLQLDQVGVGRKTITTRPATVEWFQQSA